LKGFEALKGKGRVANPLLICYAKEVLVQDVEKKEAKGKKRKRN